MNELWLYFKYDTKTTNNIAVKKESDTVLPLSFLFRGILFNYVQLRYGVELGLSKYFERGQFK